MLKYIKHHLDTIWGIEIYPIASLLIFFIFFVGVLWVAFGMKKQEVDSASAMPLEDSVGSSTLT